MIDQLFETFRRASESTLQAQQDMFKQWVQHWQAAPFPTAGSPVDWSDAQKRWLDATKETLTKQRELLESSYTSGIQVIEQAFRLSEAKSPEDYRRLMEDLWRKLSDTFKAQTETQFREVQAASQKWVEKTQASKAAS